MDTNRLSLLSHTDRTLEQHLLSCNSLFEQLISNKFISESFIEPELLHTLRQVLIFFHDLGKATIFFQQRIIAATKEENPEFEAKNREYIELFDRVHKKRAEQELNKNRYLGHHAALGAYMQFATTCIEDELVKLLILEIIKRHHGYLHNYDVAEFIIDEIELNLYQQQKDALITELFTPLLANSGCCSMPDSNEWQNSLDLLKKQRKINAILKCLFEQKTLRYFFLQHFLFSLLLSADKGDVMTTNKDIISPNQYLPSGVVDTYKQLAFKGLPTKSIDELREEAYGNIAINIVKHASENFFSITLPTGMGKTLSAYNAAILLQNQIQPKAYRIIYCLPFTSIIDQNEDILTKIFKSSNLDTSLIAKNHHLASLKEEYNELTLSYSEAEYLTEGWEQEVVVTTFVQLLESIFTNQNKSLRKFHNMTNAIILLDEVQNIPPKFYPLIETTFERMSAYFNTKFIFITATQPLLFADHDQKLIELTDPTKQLTKSYFLKQNRTELHTHLLSAHQKLTDDELSQIIQTDWEQQPDASFLVICNTIKQAQYLFQSIKTGADPKYFLSASILPCLRKDIINTVKDNTSKGIRQLLVSTQVVEAGVDIDFNVVYRDFAPLDCINQSAGRCNRNGLSRMPGAVKLFHSGKSKFIYDDILLNITQTILQQYPAVIPENQYYELNMAYFTAVKRRVQDENPYSTKLIEYMYCLQLEDLNRDFVLIKENAQYFNVFIPHCHEADVVWEKYMQCAEIADVFERKRAVKQLRPQLMQFVTKFPKNQNYRPPDLSAGNELIYEPDWRQYYDLITGFLLNPNLPSVSFF